MFDKFDIEHKIIGSLKNPNVGYGELIGIAVGVIANEINKIYDYLNEKEKADRSPQVGFSGNVIIDAPANEQSKSFIQPTELEQEYLDALTDQLNASGIALRRHVKFNYLSHEDYAKLVMLKLKVVIDREEK